MAHDFNNLLAVMLGYADMILDEPGGDLEALRDDVREIRDAARKAKLLTEELLTATSAPTTSTAPAGARVQVRS